MLQMRILLSWGSVIHTSNIQIQYFIHTTQKTHITHYRDTIMLKYLPTVGTGPAVMIVT